MAIFSCLCFAISLMDLFWWVGLHLNRPSSDISSRGSGMGKPADLGRYTSESRKGVDNAKPCSLHFCMFVVVIGRY